MDVKVRKAQNLVWACRRAYGVMWGLRPRVVHWLYVYHQAICHLCILGMVAWLSDSQCQEETKQNPKISTHRDNRNNAHHSHQCCGSTCGVL